MNVEVKFRLNLLAVRGCLLISVSVLMTPKFLKYLGSVQFSSVQYPELISVSVLMTPNFLKYLGSVYPELKSVWINLHAILSFFRVIQKQLRLIIKLKARIM